MCQLKLSYFNTYENIVPYLFITTPPQFKNISHSLLHLIFYTQIFVGTKFIMLNNLMTHFLKNFVYETLGVYIKSKQLPNANVYF